MFARSMPDISLTRQPVAYMTSRIAASRAPDVVVGSGRSIRASTCSGRRNFGSRLSSFGPLRPSMGSTPISFLRTRYLKNARRDDIFRAIVRLAVPLPLEACEVPPQDAGVMSLGDVPRPSSSRKPMNWAMSVAYPLIVFGDTFRTARMIVDEAVDFLVHGVRCWVSGVGDSP